MFSGLVLLLLRHQNWRVSPELKNRDIYLRYYTQTLFLERIRLDKGVDVSISSISDPQMLSSASESTSFCVSRSAPYCAETCLLRLLFRLQRSCTICTAQPAQPALWTCTSHALHDFC